MSARQVRSGDLLGILCQPPPDLLDHVRGDRVRQHAVQFDRRVIKVGVQQFAQVRFQFRMRQPAALKSPDVVAQDFRVVARISEFRPQGLQFRLLGVFAQAIGGIAQPLAGFVLRQVCKALVRPSSKSLPAVQSGSNGRNRADRIPRIVAASTCRTGQGSSHSPAATKPSALSQVLAV